MKGDQSGTSNVNRAELVTFSVSRMVEVEMTPNGRINRFKLAN